MQKRNQKKRTWLIAVIIVALFTGNKVLCQPASPFINEFLTLNRTILADEDGDYSDWIEIYNPLQEDIDLLNWSLTDRKDRNRMWVFPDITLRKGSYLVVFASGKNRKEPGKELHTNFSLNGDGEYLALYNAAGNAITRFDPAFPVQQHDISYGFMNGGYISFSFPTPGSENNLSGGTMPSPPVFSMKHGFYDAPFNLVISTAEQGVQVLYTSDGSAPDLGNGTLYAVPLNISCTSVIRAICINNNQVKSTISTRTYLFPDDIIHQPNNPTGYPSTWGNFLSISGTAPADYEIDPEMVADPVFAESLKEALRDLPVISLVSDKNHLFSKTADEFTGGIYIYTGTAQGTGYGWERPVSFEYFDDADSVSFQADCGVQIHGGEGRRPEKSPKHSFRLIFRREYGPSGFNLPLFGENAVKSFNNIILRAGFGNTWIHWSHSERSMAQYLRDRWTKDTQLAMGHHSSHGIYVHLFINGLYWGIYNPSERLDSDFAESYLGGNAEDYDVVKDYSEAVDGNLTAWNAAITLANAGLGENDGYQRIQGNNPDGTRNPAYKPMIDVVSLADYM
ncbi:MAG: lamin tail domain-containing protein, partial [Bacteroidales bacterium]|nr:lamin tail domain-containing protein [Bacteroidales bacterium]